MVQVSGTRSGGYVAPTTSNNTQAVKGTNNASAAGPDILTTVTLTRGSESLKVALEKAEKDVTSYLQQKEIGSTAMIYIVDTDGTRYAVYGKRIPKGPDAYAKDGVESGATCLSGSSYSSKPDWVK